MFDQPRLGRSKVGGVQEPANTSARLVAYGCGLRIIGGTGKQQPATTFASDHNPAFPAAHIGIFLQRETQRASEKANRFVIIWHYQRSHYQAGHCLNKSRPTIMRIT